MTLIVRLPEEALHTVSRSPSQERDPWYPLDVVRVGHAIVAMLERDATLTIERLMT